MRVRKIGIFNQLFILLALLLLLGDLVLGCFTYGKSKSALFEQIQGNAVNIAQCASVNVSGDILQQIAIGQEDTQAYASVVEELALFRDNADIEYIYTLRKVGEGKYEFVVDSDMEEPAAIGDECEETDAMAVAFSEGITTMDDEPFTDEWGSHLSAYSPIFYEDSIVGVVGVDISANWIDEQMKMLRGLVIVICVFTYVISLLVLQILMFRFKKSMQILNDKVKELASGSGDLTREIDIRTGDELEVIAENMNAFIRRIRLLVQDVSVSAREILLTGDELNDTVNTNAHIMTKMYSEIEDISTNMQQSAQSSQSVSEDLTESAENVSAFSDKVNELCSMAQEAYKRAQATASMAKKNRQNAMQSIDDLQLKMERAAKDAEKIEKVKQIAEEIGNIASQTRMLSLNAQIEAARAGTMGAGFAVVATEVGNLSNDIDEAVTEINGINGQVLSAIEALKTVLDEMVNFISQNVAKDYEAFAALGEEYGDTTNSIRMQLLEIGEQGIQISRNIADISQNVQSITHIVAMTADGANELADSSRQISSSFEELHVVSQKNTVHSDNLDKQVNKYTF